MLSVIPDADILFPFIQHRGPGHSLITFAVVFVPLFLVYHRKAVPLFLALAQHSVVGDYIAGGKIQLFWPVTSQYFGTNIDMRSPTNLAIEWVAFLVAMIVMTRTGELTALFKPNKSSLILIIPMFTVFLPAFLGYPLVVPLWLIPPHIVLTAVFSIAVAATILRSSSYKSNQT